MKSVTIEQHDYPSYVDAETADTYMNGSIGADDWDGTSENERKRALVEAARLLDRQRWALPWATVEKRAADAAVQTAAIEIAALVAAGSISILQSASTNDFIKRLRAGSVEIEYTGKTDAGGRFPAHVLELLGDKLVSGLLAPPAGLSIGGAYASGVGGVSTVGDTYGLTRG